MYNLIVEYFEYYKFSALLNGVILLVLIVLIDIGGIAPTYANIRKLGFHAAEKQLRKIHIKFWVKLSFILPIVAMVFTRVPYPIVWVTLLVLGLSLTSTLILYFINKDITNGYEKMFSGRNY